MKTKQKTKQLKIWIWRSFWLFFLALSVATWMAVTSAHADDEIDRRIEQSAKDSYAFKSLLKKDDIRITSKDGNVTLTGTVADRSHKSLAETTVANLPGVDRVDDQLKIEAMSSTDNLDGWTGARVKAALLFHRNVSAANTRVVVKDGEVTLLGEAESQAQKDLTAEIAKDIDGVKSVKNQIKVVKASGKPNAPLSETIDDASITAQAKMTLLYHRSTSALHTDVTTNGGVVTLTGQAQNAAEKDLATKLVSDVRGVKSVVNNMMVRADDLTQTTN